MYRIDDLSKIVNVGMDLRSVRLCSIHMCCSSSGHHLRYDPASTSELAMVSLWRICCPHSQTGKLGSCSPAEGADRKSAICMHPPLENGAVT